MELRLRYRASGKVLIFHRAKVLKNPSGSPDGACKLGFFVPYRTHWVFYPLRHSSRILYNDEPARSPCKLNAGDLIGLKGTELVVEEASAEAPRAHPRTEETPPTCYLTILGLAERRHTKTNRDLLIGSAEHCGLCLPPECGLEPEHAFLAYADGAWHLHSLTGQADLVRALGKEGYPSVQLESNDRVWLGGRDLSIRFTDTFEEEAPQPALYRPKPSSSETQPAKALLDTDAEAVVEEVIPPLTDHTQEPAYAAAKHLCAWLHNALRQPPGSGSRVWEALLAVKTRLGRRSKDPLEALQQLQTDLEQTPHNHDLLIEFARFLEARGFFDLCRLVLTEVHVLAPKDFDTQFALAKLYLMEGRQTARPLRERLELLNKAERWGRKALPLKPKHAELAVLVQQAEVEQTLLKGNLAAGSARHGTLAGH
jgi:hypothetical protein